MIFLMVIIFPKVNKMEVSEKRKLRKQVTTINLNFRVLYKFRNEKNYKIIGAGTVVKLIGKNKAIEAFCKAIGSNEQLVSFDVKNVVRFKFYSK